MSGRLPGFIYAIKGKTFGHPWMAGGYPGSNAFARRILNDMPSTILEKVWILLEKDGPRSLDIESTLAELKLDYLNEKKYKKVFEKKSTTEKVIPNKLGHLIIYKPIQ